MFTDGDLGLAALNTRSTVIALHCTALCRVSDLVAYISVRDLEGFLMQTLRIRMCAGFRHHAARKADSHTDIHGGASF